MKKNNLNKGIVVVGVIILVFFIFWFFILDLIVKNYIEKEGTKAVGARVELKSADVSLFPAGIDLIKLQVTNPDKPMENSVEIGHIQAIMEISPLFKRKVIVNNILFDKVKFNTVREYSGAIEGQKASSLNTQDNKPAWLKTFCQQNEINLFEMPDIKSILKDEYKSLKSVKLAEDIQNNISQTKGKFEKKLENLLDDKKIKEYRKRIKKIQGNDSSNLAVLGSVLEFKEIYKEIDDDLDDIKDVQKEFKAKSKKFKKDLKKLSAAQAGDIKRLKKKYSFLKGDKLELSRLLFGPSLCSLSQKYSKWFALAEPYFDSSTKQDKSKKPEKTEKSKSEDEVFFLVQDLKANLFLKNGVITGKAANITNMPAVSGKPTTFDFSGGGFKGLESLDFKGAMNLVNPAHPHHEVSFDISGLLLENFLFSDKPDFFVGLTKSVTNFTSNLKLDDNKLKVLAKAQFSEVVMQAKSIKGSSLQKALVQTLSTIDKFNLALNMVGVGDNYDISIKSNLDNFLKTTMEKMAQSKMGNFEKELKTNIMQKTAKPIKQSNKSFADFNKIGGQLSEKSAQSQALLNEID
ncbi:MAG: TIGR03545 family protein [Desulfobacteraceae bacterium]|nr:TIGR03545 family protein [Desulfobacteraceae bacterium]